MRIAIDTSPMQGGHKGRGIGKYAKLLVEALQNNKTKHSFYFFTRGEKLPKNIDLIHFPYFDPFFLTLPLFQSIPFVVTVHDLIPLAYPKKFPKGLRGEIKWKIQKKALQRAYRIIADSNASKIDIQKIVGYKPEKIDVIYLAPSSVFKPIVDRKILLKVKQKYSLPEKFVLYVGDINWNKNISGLLEAFSEVSRGVKDIQLVLVGKAFLNKQLPEVQLINHTICEMHLENSIKKLGFVPDEDLAAIYSNASVYVQPSFAEGFGFPVLEAMACGCPVVCSDVSSLTEIAGPAVKVNPNNPSNIANGIEQILGSKETQALSEKEITWAKKFSWEKVAQQTITAYERAFRGDLQ